MKLSERLDAIIQTLEWHVSGFDKLAELRAFHRELEAYESAQEQAAKLAEEKAARDARRN